MTVQPEPRCPHPFCSACWPAAPCDPECHICHPSETRDEWKRRIGVGQPQNRHHVHRGTTKTTAVIADEGPLRGRPVGKQTEHWSDRVDAKVGAMTVHVNTEALRARKETP